MTQHGIGNLLLTTVILIAVGVLGYYAVVQKSTNKTIQPSSTNEAVSTPAPVQTPLELSPLLEKLFSLDQPPKYYMKLSWPGGQWTSFAKNSPRFSIRKSDYAEYLISSSQYYSCVKDQTKSLWDCTPCTRGIPSFGKSFPDNKESVLESIRLSASYGEGWDEYLGKQRISDVDIECFRWGCFHPDVFFAFPTSHSIETDRMFSFSNVPEEEFELPEPRVMEEPKDCPY